MTPCAVFWVWARPPVLVLVLALTGAPVSASASGPASAPAQGRPAAPAPEAAAATPVGVETSPIVTWDPDRTISRPPTKRALTTAELTLARQRADQFYKAVQVSTHFSLPKDRATLVTSWAVITPWGALSQSFTPYWSSPRDVTRRTDGSLWPRMGGAHRLLYFETNDPPNADSLFDRDQNSFVRRATGAEVTDVWFPFPTVRGAIAGGTVYADYLVFTRDGRPALEPAPIGPLLEQEIARLREYTKGVDTTRALQELEASMTPEAKAARRARREEVWKKETKDPLAMAARLDAADRTDESDYQRQKADKTPPPDTSAAARDPRNWYWGTRLALTQLEATLSSLDTRSAAGRPPARASTRRSRRTRRCATPSWWRASLLVAACPWRRCARTSSTRARPTSEVQLLTVWFRESQCGATWNQPPPATPWAGRSVRRRAAAAPRNGLDGRPAGVRLACLCPAFAGFARLRRGFGAVNPGCTRDVVQRAAVQATSARAAPGVTMTRPMHALASLCWLTTLILLPALTPAASAQPAMAAQLDAVMTSAFVPDRPGAAAIVVKDGKVVYRKAIGMASMELRVPLQPDSVFRLGSITKQFTAAAVMLLVEDGKIALSDPIEKYLPGYPTQGHVITVEHLLTHTSGIQSYTSIPGWFPKKIRTDLPLLELIDGFKNEPMQFAPGERYAYNNSAYVILGAVIEKAAGETYERVLTKRIFEPLGMTRTFFGSNEPLIEGRVQGYGEDKGVIVNAQFLSMTQPHAAGSLVSTIDDLAKWDAALVAGKVLKRTSLQRMATPYTLKDGSRTGYGYGLQVGTLRGRESVEHGGGINGFATYALSLPADRIYVAVLTNSDAPKVGPGYLARRMAAIALGTPFPDRTAITVDPTVLSRYAGVYEMKGGRRTVTVDGGKLYTQRGGGQKVEARPFSATEFFYDNSLTYLRFETGADGRATGMSVFQDGGDTPERATRAADAPGATEVVRVDPSIYDTYVGEYELGPNFILTVTREGDRLMTQATGQQQIEIFPLSETEFFPKVMEARITFVKGPDGKVSQLVLRQNGREMPARRK